MKLHQLRQRLRDAGAGPSHAQRILRNWSHALARESGRRRPSTFFPAPLLAALHGQSGVRYLHRPANLEDVFLKLTGREMRD